MTWHLGFLVLSLRQVAASAKVKPPKVPKTYLMLGVQAVMMERPKDICCRLRVAARARPCGHVHVAVVIHLW